MDFSPQHFSDLIQALAQASERMESTEREVWQSRLELVYGEMDGQRAVDFSLFAGKQDRYSTIIALETLYLLITAAIGTSAFDNHPSQSLRRFANSDRRKFDSQLIGLLNGSAFTDVGILGIQLDIPFDWLAEPETHLRESLKAFLAELAECWIDDQLSLLGDDPFQAIHRQLLPTNLTHITGQFFSPEWLAELLIDDVGWTPNESLIDPFCGSGVFLVKALRKATSLGCPPAETLGKLSGIDLDPFAVAATRANVALYVARETDRTNAHTLNVVCADAIQSPPTDLKSADVVLTNPPWVGWEYLSRPYRESLGSAWEQHGVFQSRGMEASFLKEDLSNLALLVAWDSYLREGGRSAVILRPSTMHSEVASRGVRRLSVGDGATDLCLERIRTFVGTRVFPSAHTSAATWQIRKGNSTTFPVRVEEFVFRESSPPSHCSAQQICDQVSVNQKLAHPSNADDPSSRWMIASPDQLAASLRLQGENRYSPRMGVFTGGANAVFYLRLLSDNGPGQYRNVIAKAKRKVPEVAVKLESELVKPVVRGRDLHRWHYRHELYMLFPHTAQTQIKPIPEAQLIADFPQAANYLASMKDVLESRKGFAGWEKKTHQEFYYSLQRIGPYTFAPFKVCWRYIAKEFIVCVIRDDGEGTILPNDKVMFIPMDDEREAYFVAGYLSSTPVREYVRCIAQKRQIATRVIKSLYIPEFDTRQSTHTAISYACLLGHQRLAAGKADAEEMEELNQQIDLAVAAIIDQRQGV